MPDKPQKHQFPCAQCGALQTFTPGTQTIQCPWCGHTTPITESSEPIREFAFEEALARLADAPPAETRISTQCSNCAAEFDLDEHQHAGECPFCGTNIVTGTGRERHIKPLSLLPFAIDENQARKAFREWLDNLWFAPGALKRHARDSSHLSGVYVPYWTYDSQTQTRYRGERGDIYYVSVPYTATVNGRRVRRTRREQRIRWRPVAGQVRRFFDDVLVGASRSLPRKITDKLAPWDLDALVRYDERYLSGFRSEVYQVALDQGFQRAVEIMDQVIRNDIARDIGGDRQRIHEVQTRHSDTTYKHLLLPLWSAAFRYREKVYRFVVNGRSGKVQGERPYSRWKIALAVSAGLVLAILALIFLEDTGALEALLRAL